MAADLTAAARLWGRTTGRRSCSSPAWQHAPQVLHQVAVDGAETLTVNVCLHDGVDEKKSAVRLSASASCTCTLNTEGPPASDVVDVLLLTNQSADCEHRVTSLRALRTYFGSYYWQPFK